MSIMTIGKRILQFFEKRLSHAARNPEHWILGVLGNQGTISQEDALRISTVFACVRVISETISSLPLKFYERLSGGGKGEIPDYSLAYLLNQPNKFQTQMEYIETLCAHMCLRGNHYSGVNYNGGGQIVELVPLLPGNMNVEIIGDSLIYKYQDEKQQKEIQYDGTRIFHLKGLSLDGIMGLSPLSYARKIFDLSIAAETHGTAYYKNGARTPGFLSHPGKLKELTRKSLQKDINEKMSGDNKFKIIVLEENMNWINSGISAEDSQYLQTRQFSVEEICRIFRVPAVLVQHPDKTMSYASAEQFFLSFVVHTIRPWVKRIESRINLLIPPKDRIKRFSEFLLDGLLRGDNKSRYEAYAIAKQNKIMTTNEIREKENLNPVEGGDIFENPNIDTNKAKNNEDNKEDNKSEGGQNAITETE